MKRIFKKIISIGSINSQSSQNQGRLFSIQSKSLLFLFILLPFLVTGIIIPYVDKNDSIIFSQGKYKEQSYTGSTNHSEHASLDVNKEEPVTFSQNKFWWIISFILACFIYYIILILIFRRKKAVLSPNFDISQRKLELAENSEEKRLFEYLAFHYNDADLSIEKLNMELGISETKIPILVRNRTGMSFKKCLNTIRLKEAKRLLIETDHQIIQISYAVGYNTVTHFNKVFRQMENISPKEYRMKERKTEDNTV